MRKLVKLVFIITLFTLPKFMYGQVSVIANKSMKISEKITLGTVNNLYLLDINELSGNKIKLFDMSADNDTKNKFYNGLGKSGGDFKKIWLKKKLTGNGNPPSTVDNDDDMLSKIASTPGSVGYISSSKVNGTVQVLFEIK